MSTPDSQRSSSKLKQKHSTFHEGEGAMLRKRILKQLRQVNAGKLQRRMQRGGKWLSRRRNSHQSIEKRPVFIVGCNRSGTNMVCKAIGNSPYGWDYPESAFSVAFKGFYLRSYQVIELLIRYTPAPIISFGSILDSQSTAELLSQFQGARAIWVYRHYEDVANSCARMQWGPHLKDLIRWVARDEIEKLGARGQKISPDTVNLFAELFHEELTNEDTACLYWYMRNRLYFDLNLHTDPRVLIMQYEDTVLCQERAFQRIFNFLDCPYDPAAIDGIFASSVGKNSPPQIDPAIQEVNDSLKTRLDAKYARTSNWITEKQITQL